MQNDEFVDYYDFLMVSPNADRAMIEWAVRLMLARYGKKNEKTADPKKVQLVRDAYRTLADSSRRAAYDRIRQDRLGLASPGASPAPAADESPARASKPVAKSGGASALSGASEDPPRTPTENIRIELTASVDDVRYQRRIRQAIMSALYDILVTRPRNPELGRAEIARTIGVQVDEIEFPVWFLREQGLLKTTTQGLYALTSNGADWVERGGVPHLSPKPAEVIDRLTPKSADPESPRSAAAGGPRRVL